MVYQSVFSYGLPYTQQDTQSQRDRQRNDTHSHGYGELFTNNIHHGHARLNTSGFTEVQVEQIPIEVQQLFADGVGQPRGRQCGFLLFIGKLHLLLFGKVVVRRQHTHQQEHDSGDEQDSDQALQQAPERIL